MRSFAPPTKKPWHRLIRVNPAPIGESVIDPLSHPPADDYDFDGIKRLHTSGDRAANVFRINLLRPCSPTIPSVERWSAIGNQLRKDAKLIGHAIAIATVPKPEDPMIAAF
jgi:hypothetical protein